MSDEEALQNILHLLSSLKIIDFWSIAITNKDQIKIHGLVIRGQPYGEIDEFSYEYITKKKLR